jgi:hypothetical protein
VSLLFLRAHYLKTGQEKKFLNLSFGDFIGHLHIGHIGDDGSQKLIKSGFKKRNN